MIDKPILRSCYVCNSDFYEFSEFADDDACEGEDDLACNQCAQDNNKW